MCESKRLSQLSQSFVAQLLFFVGQFADHVVRFDLIQPRLHVERLDVAKPELLRPVLQVNAPENCRCFHVLACSDLQETRMRCWRSHSARPFHLCPCDVWVETPQSSPGAVPAGPFGLVRSLVR